MNKSHHILIFNTKNIFSTIIYIYFHSETRINIKDLKALKAGKNSQHYSQEWNIYVQNTFTEKKNLCQIYLQQVSKFSFNVAFWSLMFVLPFPCLLHKLLRKKLTTYKKEYY